MKHKRLAIRSVVANWLGRACSLLIVFFLTPFVVHTLGDESYGLWAILMSVTSHYALADMGLRGAATKYLAQYDATEDRRAINRVMATSLAVYMVLALCCFLIAICLALVFPLLFDIGDQNCTVIEV